jgi:hypothetical protein
VVGSATHHRPRRHQLQTRTEWLAYREARTGLAIGGPQAREGVQISLELEEMAQSLHGLVDRFNR